MDVNSLRSFLDESDQSDEECIERLHAAREWMEKNIAQMDMIKPVDVIALYNKCRKCALSDTHKDVVLQVRALACFLLKQLTMVGLSESLDLLRCFSRTGQVLRDTMIESHVIATPKACFDEAITIYKSIGLHHLAKSISGVELQAICEDIWDAFEGHLSCLSANTIDEMIHDIDDMRMIIPYVPQNGSKYVNLVMKQAENLRKTGIRDGEATILGIALELIETLDNLKKKPYKRRVLSRLVDVYIELELFDKAESCCRLLLNSETPEGLLSGVKLYTTMKSFPRAQVLVERLQELDNFDVAGEATRMYCQAVGYDNKTAIQLVEALKLNFPEHTVDIDLDLATELSFAESKHLREKSCEIIAITAQLYKSFSCDQISRVKKIIQDASYNASNYEHYEELYHWTEVALSMSESSSEKAICQRMMSNAKLRLGDIEVAHELALQAIQQEPSKKSLYAYFRVLVNDSSHPLEAQENVIVQLIACDDFDVYDLLAFGKEAHLATRLLFERVLTSNECPQLPMGLLYQNIAQLSTSQVGAKEDHSISKFMKILEDVLVVAEKIEPSQAEASFGPFEVFEWFFGMCHNIGVNTKDWKCFIQAARIVKVSKMLFPTTNTKLVDREQKCLLAAITLRLKNFESLGDEELREVANIIGNQRSCGVNSSLIEDYLATSMFMIKIKLRDFHDTKFIEESVLNIERTWAKFRDLGDFVFLASRSTTTEGSTTTLRAIASQLYKHGLQLELQKEQVDSHAAIYALKKLVELSKSKDEGLEWLGQVAQIMSSLQIEVCDDDIEWLVARSWNFGVSCFRNQELKMAQKFMQLALEILVSFVDCLLH
ncbi:hypothetical protein Ae201684_010209 [Aphanomyces euteiches]|uniref:Protein ZIP4 homolog n=1 Tax=Aphanomyces euteiches TaxID=100861 RepID=A0A6G0WZ44_9STRA|nr:hypothetical protein Ae201684_010209 [Aphanomyces euteiches]